MLQQIGTCTLKHNIGTVHKVLSWEHAAYQSTLSPLTQSSAVTTKDQSGCSMCNNVTRHELYVFGIQGRDANAKHSEQARVAALPHLRAVPRSILTTAAASVTQH